MGIINAESIIAYDVGGELVCAECVTPAEETEVLEENLYTENSQQYKGDSLMFCDRCKKRLN